MFLISSFKKHPIWLSILGVVFTAILFVFTRLGFLEFFTLIPFFIGCFLLERKKEKTWKQIFFFGFFTFFFYYFLIYHWVVYMYPMKFLGLSNFDSILIILLAWIGYPILQAIPAGLGFLLLFIPNKLHKKQNPYVFTLSILSLWILLEWTQTFFFIGIPWGRLSLPLCDYLPFLQSSSLFGPYFVSFVILFVNGFLALCFFHVKKKERILTFALACMLFLGNFIFGIVRVNTPIKENNEKSIRIAVIQGNISADEKWDANSLEQTFTSYCDLTKEACEQGAELVIWSESVFPMVINNETSSIQKRMTNIAIYNNTTIMFGAFYQDGDDVYNVIYLVNPDGTWNETHYAKQKLVPFGEYLPMETFIKTFLPTIAQVSSLGNDLTKGTKADVYQTSFGTIGTEICFDSIYESVTRDIALQGSQLIILATNDAWFKDSPAVFQHVRQAQLRAIESGKTICRSANTGISCFIDPYGNVTSSIDPLVSGYSMEQVQMNDTTTIYTRIGNLLVYLILLWFSISLAIPFVKLKSKS